MFLIRNAWNAHCNRPLPCQLHFGNANAFLDQYGNINEGENSIINTNDLNVTVKPVSKTAGAIVRA